MQTQNQQCDKGTQSHTKISMEQKGNTIKQGKWIQMRDPIQVYVYRDLIPTIKLSVPRKHDLTNPDSTPDLQRNFNR